MNPDESSNAGDALPLDVPGQDAEPHQTDAARERRRIAWLRMIKQLLLCNPFYLCSSGLLLYGINRLSVDPNFLASETGNLLFNFSALQAYELLVIVTAIVLASRKVWYDSALLVVLENGLVLIPFMLISHATFLDKGLGWTLSLAGVTAVVGRFYAIQRLYPQFYLPAGALGFGALILGLNVALPPVFRWWSESDLELWHGPTRLLWYVVMPLLAGLANLLPRPTKYGGLNPERPWLPLFIYGLWLIGTGVHVWCLGYISRLSFEVVLVAPAVCACAWTAFNRLSDCVLNPSPLLKGTILLLAFLTPLLAINNPVVLTALSAVNAIGFIALCRIEDGAVRKLAKELAFLSATMMFASLPLGLVGGLSRPEHVCGAAVLCCIVMALRSPDPRVGLLGGVGVAAGAAWLLRDWTFHPVAQVSCMFILAHSLRWHKGVRAAEFLRFTAALIWMFDAIVWTWTGTFRVSVFVGIGGVVMLAIWAVYAWRTRTMAPLVVPASAAFTFCAGPANWFYSFAPGGVIALVASVVLFAIGTVLAWHRNAVTRL